MHKKKIIFPLEYEHLTGGMIFSVISLIKVLAEKLNYEVVLLAPKNAQIFNLQLNVKCVRLENSWVVDIKRPIATLKTYVEVRKKLLKEDLTNSLILTNDVGSELICSGFGLFRIPSKRVFISRGGNYSGKTGFFLRMGFKSVTKFIAISNRQKKILLSKGVKSQQISIIHNGVSTLSNFTYKISKNGKTQVSIIGYINSNKNQILAVEAISLLRSKGLDVTLNIFGIAYSDSDKKYKKKLDEKIELLSLQNFVFYKGFEKDSKAMYENTDILISCSLSEGFGRTIIEAMSYGIPCVGLYESGGLLDIIENEKNGFLVSNNKIELSNTINKIMSNNSLRKNISDKAIFTYKKKFTNKIMTSGYIDFLSKL